MQYYQQQRRYPQAGSQKYYGPNFSYSQRAPPVKHNYILMAVIILIIVGASFFLFKNYLTKDSLNTQELELGSSTTPPPLPADGYQQPATNQNIVQGRDVNPIDPFPSFPNTR